LKAGAGHSVKAALLSIQVSVGENFSRIHMGSCRNKVGLGSVMHEVGHVLGLTHEQQRPDASSESKGYGPYLKVYWDTINKEGKLNSYKANEHAYVGSADDSNGSGPDPHVGHAPYDFQSIMHYGGRISEEQPFFATIPADQARFVGNRKFLTEHDVKAVSDMYQCVRRTPAMTTTTTTTTTTATTTTTNGGSNATIWVFACFGVLVCACCSAGCYFLLDPPGLDELFSPFLGE